jgi:MerR family transcriptional regulator, thiopeptide resistance regulator
VAPALLGQLGRKLLLLLLEVVEFHFDQLPMFQRMIQGGKELRANAVFADLERGLQPLGLGFQSADFCVVERNHGPNFSPIPTQREHYRSLASISKLARACGLSRSTLLYYDRLGLLKPSGRNGSGYRYYTDAEQRRLERIGHFRQAGLSLREIRAILSTGGKLGTRLLEKRLGETAEQIVGLKHQQRLLAGMLRPVAAGKRPPIVDKRLWVEMLNAAGMDQEARHHWHSEFERRAPAGHQEFLLSLGIPENEVNQIRRWSRGEIHGQED